MYKNLPFLFVLFFNISFAQNSTLIEKANLPKEYKAYVKEFSFLKLIEKSIAFKQKKNGTEIIFKGDGDDKAWFTQEYFFEENFYSTVESSSGDKIRILTKTISYHYKNLRLRNVGVSFFDNLGHTKKGVGFYFNKNGTLNTITQEDYDKYTSTSYRFDLKGNFVEKYSPDMDEKEIVDTLRVPLPKLLEIKEKINPLINGYDFHKPTESFSVKEWKRYFEINDYLKKVLNSKNNIYYNKMSDDQLDIFTEDGELYGLSLYIMKTQNLDEYIIVN